MSSILGTNVAAMIVPFDTADIYATHCDKYGQGGFRAVNTIQDRDNIPELRRSIGMWVKVIEENKVYELWGDLNSWREVEFAPPPDTRFAQSSSDINPGETVIMESLPFSYFRALKWMMVIESNDGRMYQYEISAHVNNDTIQCTKKYAMIGTKINAKIDMLAINNSIKILFQNNESTGIKITVLRLPILR